ncbi:pyruvate dehydrogenase E2 component (dihydrolipoamide acetyltransferase) [Pseudonocardia sediminis]|uniref:Dihydrolipoamide acetyltransferase component of pyruvate dehydrogenase complex n=1 Tax=Pseudonocardia sediminis TaxID=1397368 RepID=A0A4Q7V6N4_PSEST|nr:dihydrolipoamide acetyltransferase family protein [Pseudonocardia sediminis]RZT89164.1 pyruvate dehydrogenase E2 component (dihydrolipoamide acetyltransferase) [Pseudonocardia sediminis]
MTEVFRLPDVGEGLTEAEILDWRVAPGDTVTVNQVLVEIETAKAAVELPSPYAGTVGELLVEPGQTVQVGAPIIAIETAGTAASPGSSPAPSTAAAGSAAGAAPENGAKIGEAGKDGRIATLVGYGPRQGTATRRPRHGAAVTPSPANGAAGRGATVPLAPPPVRKLARDLGVDLKTLTGSGPNGRITRADIEAAAAAPAASPGAADPGSATTDTAAGSGTAPAAGAAVSGAALSGAAVSGGAGTAGRGATAPGTAGSGPASVGGTRREPIRGVRKATAAAMVSSAFTAPHVTEFLAVDVTETMELRERMRARRDFAEVKLTPLAFVAKAVCLAAARTPEVNASWDEPAGEIVFHDRVQLGIAAATPRGLIVPKVRDADLLGLREMAAALGTLTETARSGRTPPADLVGGTFTITNVGVFGVDTGTPIINPGEAAILAVGAIKPTPWVVDGELAVRTVCRLALSFDHRLVDGEQGSRFLADVGALLEDPGVAFTW